MNDEGTMTVWRRIVRDLTEAGVRDEEQVRALLQHTLEWDESDLSAFVQASNRVTIMEFALMVVVLGEVRRTEIKATQYDKMIRGYEQAIFIGCVVLICCAVALGWQLWSLL